MRMIALLPIALLAAGCGDDSVDMKNASVDEVARRKCATRAPTTSSSIRASGSSRSAWFPSTRPACRRKRALRCRKQWIKSRCIRSAQHEEAKSPREDFFTGKDKSCRYEHFKWGGGKIDLKMRCEHPGANQVAELAGGARPRRYTMTMTATNEGSGPDEQFAMKMKVDAKHVGACDTRRLHRTDG